MVLVLHEALEGSAWQKQLWFPVGEKKSRFLIMTLNKFMDMLSILKSYGDW